MTGKEKRRFCGCMMPNIFFLLQLVIILLILLIALQTISIFNAGTIVAYIYIFFALVAIGYCAVARRNVINRQYQHCDEYAKWKNKRKLSQ